MTTTLEASPVDSGVQRLRNEFLAMRLSFSWLGVRKSLTMDQCSQAAMQFGAERTYLSAAKKLLDTGHPAMKAVNQIKRQMTLVWKANSLPYPESGIRLVSRDEVERLNERMLELSYELEQAIEQLQSHYSELKDQARGRLGNLFERSDYPEELRTQFNVTWDFPSVEPPSYLQRLQPELYQQECERVRQRFADAVEMAEQAFLDELSGLVSHLTERLSGNEDGKPKVFRDTAIENLAEFFERFSRLNIASLPELDSLVQRAQDVVSGVSPSRLRKDADLRSQVATQLSGVQSVLDGLMVDRPRRKLIRG